jgi:putative cardiolipin synthase
MTTPPPWAGARRPVRTFVAVCLAALLCACAVTAPGPEHRTASYALSDSAATALGRRFGTEAQRHPGLSGFDLVTSGREAFDLRYALAQRAQRTIDVQYYIWESDGAGRALLAALIAAADRGVRVRMLLDDLSLEGRDDGLAVLNAHPNIRVRLFNPFMARSDHLVDFLFDFARVNHRMHNKAFIVDNAVAVVGGRNIGDAYFSANDQSNFRDIDLLAAGPIVHQISADFDAFWNSVWSRSIRRFVHRRPDEEEIHDFVDQLHQRIAADHAFPFTADLNAASLDDILRRLPARLIWGKATVLADLPDKPETSEPEIVEELRADVGPTLRHDLLLESAYFIPAGDGTAHLCALVKRGIRVRVLTNSAATNDELSAYAGYARYREDLLRCGVELYELRPDAGFVRHEWTWLRNRSTAALHTKAAVFDGDKVLIGSFNLDPRSAKLNTELALLIDSRPLASKVAAFIETGMKPGNAYALQLDLNGNIAWLARDAGALHRLDEEPYLNFWRSLEVDILSLLPIEQLL